jgi:hypothetical protein
VGLRFLGCCTVSSSGFALCFDGFSGAPDSSPDFFNLFPDSSQFGST